MKGFAQQNPRVTQSSNPLLGDKSFDCIELKKICKVFIRSRNPFTKNRIGGKCYQVKVVGLKRGCFLLLKIRRRKNFPPFGPDLILSDTNALAICLQHILKGRLPNDFLSTFLGRGILYIGYPISGSTKAMTWPTHASTTV